ncbi:11541_t:CDS:2 [Ambispora gerdemannii]|uniref:11541_t:CDS:1 n=1 Tax=Ambispora gerdemannii TaxID=144530 RepID=A0A9N9FZZ6_9GLOM|nr:11541_t:CDS:2 [Ambispora gerdemannii]
MGIDDILFMNRCEAFSVPGLQDVENTISPSSSSNNSTESFGASTAEKPTSTAPYLIVSSPGGRNSQQYFPDDIDNDLEESNSEGESTLIWDASHAMGLAEGETTIPSPPPAYQQLPQTKKSKDGSSRHRPRDLSEIPVPLHLKLSSAPNSPKENDDI